MELTEDELLRTLHELRCRGFEAESAWEGSYVMSRTPTSWLETILHELAHWRTLYKSDLPEADGSLRIDRRVKALAADDRDMNEALTVAVELHAFEMLGIEVTNDQLVRLFMYAASGTSSRMNMTMFARLVRFEFMKEKSLHFAERVVHDVIRIARGS